MSLKLNVTETFIDPPSIYSYLDMKCIPCVIAPNCDPAILNLPPTNTPVLPIVLVCCVPVLGTPIKDSQREILLIESIMILTL